MVNSTNASNYQFKKYLIFTAIILNLIAIILISLGAIRWFHFPYLLFLDEWHFLWLMVALSCGLILSQFILDPIITQNISRFLIQKEGESLTTELKIVVISAILGGLGIMILEVIMILWGISSALRGLVNLGLGMSGLWSSRFYWIAVFAE
jgi:hypothetical protein